MDSIENFMPNKQVKKLKNVKIVSQNVRGLKSESRLEELFSYAARFGVFALCLQETWRTENEILENEGYLLLTTGLPSKEVAGKRGSQGTAIALSSEAQAAWRLAGSELHVDFGARMIAIRLLVKDEKGIELYLFLVSAYAPVSTAPDS